MRIERLIAVACGLLMLGIFTWKAAEAQTRPVTCTQCAATSNTYLVPQYFKQGFTADGGTFTNNVTFQQGFMADGGQFSNTIFSTMNDGGITLQTTQGTQPVKLFSNIADPGAGATAFILDSTQALTGGGRFLLEARTAGTQRFRIGGGGETLSASYFQSAAGLFTAVGNVSAELKGTVTDGASAVGTILNTTNALSTTGAKIASFRTNGVEKNSFDKDGYLFFPAANIGPAWGTPASITATISYDGANRIALSPGAGATANQWGNPNTGAANVLISNRTNAASAIGTVINTANVFSGASSKLVSIQNGTTEKYAFDFNGKPQTTFTNTSGTPGSGTANTTCGRSAIATAANTATITNSLVSATSNVFLQLESTGIGVGALVAVPGAGSFVVSSVAGAGVVTVVTGTTVFSWCVYN